MNQFNHTPPPSPKYPSFDSHDRHFIQLLTDFLFSTDKELTQNGYTPAHLTAIYRYCDKNGNLLYFKPRFDKDGKKWIKPCWYDGNRCYLGEPTKGESARYSPKAKPLYLLPDLATAHPAHTVYFVEGEKCANALSRLGFVVTTAGASSSTSTTDLTPLIGRSVRLWRDYDSAGQKWLDDMATALDALKIAFDVIDVDSMAKQTALNPSDDAHDHIARLENAHATTPAICQNIQQLPIIAGVDYLQQAHAKRQAPAPTIHASNDDKWGEIIPFDEVKNIETPFPVTAFGAFLAKVVEKTAYYQQIPLSMAGFGVLGALSHIGQGFINAPYVNNDHNPASLFLVVQGESGSGKTQTIKITHKAILDFERTEYETFKDDKRMYDNELAGKSKKEIKAFHEQNHKPADPRSMFGSGSVQKVMQGFTDGNYQNASYTADEGANLLDGASLKAETAGSSIGAICDIYSKGIAERVTISNTGNQIAYNVRLTLFLCGQDVALKPALNNPRLTQQGLLPRCLFAFPPDNRGNRKLITENFTTDATLQEYWQKCHNFLSLPLAQDKRKMMAWQAPALKLAQEYWQKVENSQQKTALTTM